MNNFEHYAQLTAQITALTEQRDALKEVITAEVLASGQKTLATPLGKFSLRSVNTWEYPEYVNEAKETYDEIKAKSVEVGDATCTESTSLSFTPVKL